MQFRELRVTINPNYAGNSTIRLGVIVKIDGIEYTYSQILDDNMLISYFDNIWLEAGEQIKHAIKRSTKVPSSNNPNRL